MSFALRDLPVGAQSVVIRRQRRLAAMFDDYDTAFGEHVCFAISHMTGV